MIIIKSSELDDFLHALLEIIDHDIAKDYKEETAEDPDLVESLMGDLYDVVDRYNIGE